MIDFHAHILSGIDDGARSSALAVDMLSASYRQGIDTVISTSHCYVTDPASIHTFLDRRAARYARLCAVANQSPAPLPHIRLGAEVHMERDFSAYPDIDKLCIEGTDYMLVEMPYGRWRQDLYDCLYSLRLHGIRPILAHIERYAAHAREFNNLRGLDLLYQVNADSFFQNPGKRFLAKLYADGMIHVLGSDMHDMDRRAPHMQKAVRIIRQKYGKELLLYLQQNAETILENGSIVQKQFPPLGFWQKIRL